VLGASVLTGAELYVLGASVLTGATVLLLDEKTIEEELE